jgi:hypothetical protein
MTAEGQAQGHIIGNIIYPDEFDIDKILVTISSAIPFLDQHPEYIPILKHLSARAAEGPVVRVMKIWKNEVSDDKFVCEYSNRAYRKCTTCMYPI